MSIATPMKEGANEGGPIQPEQTGGAFARAYVGSFRRAAFGAKGGPPQSYPVVLLSFGLGFTPEDHGDPSMGATCTLTNKT